MSGFLRSFKNKDPLNKSQDLLGLEDRKKLQVQEVKRISFSELKNWKECPYRHKLIYVDKLPYFSGNEYTAFGTAIHAVCEKTIPKPEINPIQVFNEEFSKEVSLLKSSGVEVSAALIEDMKNQAKPICNQLLPSVREHFGKFTVVSVEDVKDDNGKKVYTLVTLKKWWYDDLDDDDDYWTI